MPNKGFKHSEETKQKMSAAHKGHVFSKERNEKLSRSLKGRVFTDEWKRKISEAKKGVKMLKPKSEETRKKLSQALKGHSVSAATREKISKTKSRPEVWDRPYSPHFHNKIRPQIIKRDGRCRNAGCDGVRKRLHVHHIDHDPSNNAEVNLITLCIRCHRYHHSRKGFIVDLGEHQIKFNTAKIQSRV